MKQLFALCLLGVFISKLNSQNLIPNPGIESYTKCPTNLKQLDYTLDWFSSSTGTPEYYNSCGFPGNVSTRSGDGMMGAIFFAAYYIDLEYVSVRLNQSLVKDQWYCFEFFVQPEASNYLLMDKIGAYFSAEKILLPNWKFISRKPQVVLKSIAQVGVWTKVSGSFMAEGGEEYLCIGNFYEKEKVGTQLNAKERIDAWYSYYYLDDFNLYASDGNCAAKNENNSLPEKASKNEHTVYFESDQFLLSLEQNSLLVKFIQQLPASNKIQLKLVGHTDSDASESYNVLLSKNRVEEVSKIVQSIRSMSTSNYWKGENAPINGNRTEEDKAKNRRVTITAMP